MMTCKFWTAPSSRLVARHSTTCVDIVRRSQRVRGMRAPALHKGTMDGFSLDRTTVREGDCDKETGKPFLFSLTLGGFPGSSGCRDETNQG